MSDENGMNDSTLFLAASLSNRMSQARLNHGDLVVLSGHISSKLLELKLTARSYIFTAIYHTYPMHLPHTSPTNL